MAAIPNADAAVIDRRKIANYVLDPDHRLGRHKARVFAAALGLRRREPACLSRRFAGRSETKKQSCEGRTPMAPTMPLSL